MPNAALFVVAALAAVGCAVLIRIAMPLLVRYAMARPNARSSHRVPTPQGGGGPVVLVAAAALLAAIPAGLAAPGLFHGVLVVSALSLALVGAIDDIRPLPAGVRLALQGAAVGAVLVAAPVEWRLMPSLPVAAERALALVAGVWFVNLTNFMDGIDGITVSEMVPVSGTLGLYLASSAAPAGALLAAALCGALLGFLLFNRPPARVFLGDVGSLPIGLIVAALLFEAATRGGLVPALILPLYYLYDATETLVLRWRAGENLFEAHRRHAYQNAVDGGWSATRVDGHVLALNGVLCLLAWASLGRGLSVQIACLAVACAATVALSRRFRSLRP